MTLESTRRLLMLALCSGGTLLAWNADAQLLPRPEGERAQLVGSLAGEPDVELNLAGVLPASVQTPGAELSLAAGAEWAMLLPARGDVRVQLGALGSYVWAPRWGVVGVLWGWLARAKNDAATLLGLGLELRAQPHHVFGGWQLGLDLGWQNALTTHIRHSALARRTFEDRYPSGVVGIQGPRAGWYRFTSTRFRTGLSASARLGEHWTGALALGSLLALQEQGVWFGFNLAQLPFYLELATAYAF